MSKCILKCNKCGAELAWIIETKENLALPEDEQKAICSSDYVEGYTTCRCCIEEYCINHNCMDCKNMNSKTDNYKDCRFYGDKEFWLNEMKNEENSK